MSSPRLRLGDWLRLELVLELRYIRGLRGSLASAALEVSRRLGAMRRSRPTIKPRPHSYLAQNHLRESGGLGSARSCGH